MLYDDLKQGNSYRFAVIKEKSTRKYFKVKTDDDHEFSLLKFKFQQNVPIPDYIDCYVKSLLPTTISQDISIFINNFYDEGKEYDFTVKSVKQDSETQYELEDKHGLCFKLFKAPFSLPKGSRVKCKITKIRGAMVVLKYVGTLSLRLPLEFIDIYQWLNALNITSHHDTYLKLLESLPEFHDALCKYDEGEAGWILDLLQESSSHITNWLIACKNDLKMLAKVYRRMNLARDLTLHILEGSDYLRACNEEQRTMLQTKLSNYVEHFNQYGQAAKKILTQTHEEFIDGIFSRLKNAGYLYHPSKQFRIMMTILKLRPELINSRMGELFEALHNWEIDNWHSDPFRPALVEQLQIFIEENCLQVNLLPSNDSSEENKTIIRMVLAIAIQRLLATESDNIDLSLNKARLYRYISYLNPKSTHILLNKGIEALLGVDAPNEFSWNDTDHSTLLIEKLSHISQFQEEQEMAVKMYSTSKANILLRPDRLQIIARNADSNTTALPNQIFDWLNPSISLNDGIQTPNPRKAKDLKSYRTMWEDIEWSIYGEDQCAGKRINKTLPEGGEDVRIIIDNIRTLRYGNEKQRLQFHCTIHDDNYYGEGWMPCDALHMIGWLTERDIPNNYDGSLRFAQNEDGTPLHFVATAYWKGTELEFYLKTQIEEYLLETSFPGQESLGIVTYFDRGNNAWLVLSERGSTFKVARDESTADLSEGRLVRVKYLEQDQSNSTTQFFIGELSPNQDNIPPVIKKSQCLFNLMQGLGISNEDSSESFEVLEGESVMSKEQLMELIYMLQRRAFYETEYLRAFNYLGLAHVICKLSEDESLLRDIESHMDLLQLLQDFGRNQKIDCEELMKCEDKVKHTPMLERLHTRLKIVSRLDMNENTDWLWEMSQNPRNETEGRLASLVLSHNLLPKELESSRKDIFKEITTLLNVNNAAPTSKYYGDESQTVEFKSSLIYSTHGGSRPEPKEQLHEITHIISGFMNARGGTLYIGVNDSGYENGLDDDLEFRKNHNMKPKIDSMIVDLQNHLDRTMPSHAKDHWEISSDPESRKGVIVVNVLPVELPVELDGIIYVRSSSTTKPRLGEERDEFIKNRRHNFNLLMNRWGVTGKEGNATPKTSDTKPVVMQKTPDEGEKTSEPEKRQSQIPANDNSTEQIEKTDNKESDEILTGRHRQNVLHESEPQFVNPAFYLYFSKGNKMSISYQDRYYDCEEECLLALAVKEKEKTSNAVLSYACGHTVKLPLANLSTFTPYEKKSHGTCSRLSHVNIGNDNDYLISVIKSQAGPLFYRIDKISDISCASNLSSIGETLCEGAHVILAQDVLTKEKLSFFNPDAINKEKRFFGVSVPMGDGTLSEEERIEKLLRPLAHAE